MNKKDLFIASVLFGSSFSSNLGYPPEEHFVSQSVTLSKNELLGHKNVYIERLAEIAESVIFSDDSLSNVLKIKIPHLTRKNIVLLGSLLPKVFSKDQLSEAFEKKINLCYVKSIDLSRLAFTTSFIQCMYLNQEDLMFEHEYLISILKYSEVEELEIMIQHEKAIIDLVNVLSRKNHMKKIKVLNIAQQASLDALFQKLVELVDLEEIIIGGMYPPIKNMFSIPLKEIERIEKRYSNLKKEKIFLNNRHLNIFRQMSSLTKVQLERIETLKVLENLEKLSTEKQFRLIF